MGLRGGKLWATQYTIYCDGKKKFFCKNKKKITGGIALEFGPGVLQTCMQTGILYLFLFIFLFSFFIQSIIVISVPMFTIMEK